MKDLRGLKIHCETKEEKKELLEEATKQGFGWYACGQKPLELKISLEVNNYTFYEDKTITHNTSDTCIFYKEYKASGFTKADLKPCMVVVLRDGHRALVGMTKYGTCIDFQNRYQCLIVNEYNDDMTFPDSPSNDIVKVFGYAKLGFESIDVNAKRDLIWKDNSVKISISDAEEELNKLSGKKYKIVKE